jgi:hypothetical protein
MVKKAVVVRNVFLKPVGKVKRSRKTLLLNLFFFRRKG